MNYHRLRGFQKQITQIILLVTSYSLLVTGLTGCGYTTRSMISDKYRTIYIEPFVNKIDITQETDVGSKYKIYRPALETDVTKKVSNKFLFDGNLRPAKKQTADLTLKSELLEFRRDPVRYTDDNEIEEYRLNIVVNISLWDNRQNQLLWEEKGFTGQYAYFTLDSPLTDVTKYSDTAAAPVNSAIDDLARRIVERTVEEW